jgi:hypothetical protein
MSNTNTGRTRLAPTLVQQIVEDNLRIWGVWVSKYEGAATESAFNWYAPNRVKFGR